MVRLKVEGIDVAGPEILEHPRFEVVHKAVETDTLLHAYQDFRISRNIASQTFLPFRHENNGQRTLITMKFNRAHRTYDVEISSILFTILPKLLAARVIGVKHVIQRILVKHQVVLTIGIIGKLGRCHAFAG